MKWLLRSGGRHALAAALLAGPAWACNVPVFRYALERWRPDPYQLVVFHRGPLAGDDEARVKVLRAASLAEEGLCNFGVTLHDVDSGKSESLKQLWQAQKQAQLPWTALRAPAREPGGETVWAGALADAKPEYLLDSPARREIVRRLCEGETAVWLLLKSGQAAKDKAAAKLLATELQRLEKEMALPEGIGEPGSELMSAVPLKIKFSVLEMVRADPAEQIFIRMLLSGQPDLEKADGPIAFPVFGCARVLGGLAGDVFTAEVIENAVVMLCGACSCQIKEMNPGYDLLVRAAWDALLTGEIKPAEMPPLKGFADFAAQTNAPAAVVEPKQPAPATHAPPAPQPSGALRRNLVIAAVFGILCVVVVTILLRMKRS
jgi:hypothetical protein